MYNGSGNGKGSELLAPGDGGWREQGKWASDQVDHDKAGLQWGSTWCWGNVQMERVIGRNRRRFDT